MSLMSSIAASLGGYSLTVLIALLSAPALQVENVVTHHTIRVLDFYLLYHFTKILGRSKIIMHAILTLPSVSIDGSNRTVRKTSLVKEPWLKLSKEDVLVEISSAWDTEETNTLIEAMPV